MPERARTFSPGERISIGITFAREGGSEIESVEAIFAREGSNEEIRLLGDAKKEASGREEETIYSARLEAKVEPEAAPGEYRCVRLTARDRFDDDWEFADVARLDLVVRVERPPHRLEVTASDFL
ncbi:MAG: hypothetical protein AVDCRST_MAG78-1506 [uncultured Rubrobacteraceae bacterium]|uniref:Uncharacterized protein n=1 Tax=uncultured Rubrobacteraceae bacterium TaxID=349277 RepID=A0A6J4PY77_9ACTN|nr:MAG: hypothetical protein AVDCRST_MAG78-1506 [uncultured Rubrobacteraceae bacterium]